jgi:hypothetical protein
MLVRTRLPGDGAERQPQQVEFELGAGLLEHRPAGVSLGERHEHLTVFE